jgi:hypothetical protein
VYILFTFYLRLFSIRASNSSANGATFYFYCSQSQILSKKSRKSFEIEKHRDRETIDRFDCNGCLKIKLHNSLNKVSLKFVHKTLHERPDRVDVTEEMKLTIGQQLHLSPKDIFSGMEMYYPNLTQKQVHYWWTRQVQASYKKDNDQLLSAKMLLEEAQFDILLFNCEEGVKYVGFVTNFFNQLKSNSEIIFDATCKQKLKH